MNSLQTKTKQEEHNCIKTLVKPNDLACTKPTERADFYLRIKGNHLQSRLNINMEAWQRQEEAKGILPTAAKQNRRLNLSPQAAEQQRHRTVCQPTLRAMKNLAWCMDECGNSKEGIFIHEIRSQDSKIIRRVLTEPTRTSARSCARQFLDKGWLVVNKPILCFCFKSCITRALITGHGDSYVC